MKNRNHNKIGFLKQATILIFAGIFVRIIGFLYRVPMQNILGDEGTGIYSQAYNIYIFFFVLSSAGLPVAISKMVSARYSLKKYNNVKRIFYVSMSYTIITGLIFSTILYLNAKNLANFINSPDVELSIKMLAPTVFIVSIMSVYRGYFQGMGNSMPTAISQIIEQLFNAIFSIYLVYIFIDKSIIEAAAGGTAASGIGSSASLLFLFIVYILMVPYIKKKSLRTKDNEKLEPIKKLYIELIFTSIPIIVGTAIFSLTNLIDTKMTTSILINNGFNYIEAKKLFGQLNGKYVVITTLPVSIATAIATASIPSISSCMVIKDTKELNKKINLTLRISMIIAIPSAFGIGVLGEPILKLLFPNSLEGSILLKVGAPSIIFLSLSQIATGILQGLGKLTVPALSALCGVIVKVPLNLLLVSINCVNIVGAVISTTICYIISSFINIFVVCKITKININFKKIFLKPLLCAFIMSLICYVFYYTIYYINKNNITSLIISIFLGIISYFIFMILIRGITEEDLNEIPNGKKLVNKFKKLGLL